MSMFASPFSCRRSSSRLPQKPPEASPQSFKARNQAQSRLVASQKIIEHPAVVGTATQAVVLCIGPRPVSTSACEDSG